MILILVCVILIILSMVSWISVLRGRARCKLPGPVAIPILGNAHLFIVKSTEFLNLLHKFSLKYGDAFQAHLFTMPYIALSHPKYIEPIVSSYDLISKGRAYNLLSCWLGQGLLTASGQRWKAHRKFLTPAFHFNILQNFLPVFCKNQQVLLEKLRKLADGQTIDLFPIIALVALDNVTESVMGVSLDVQKHSTSEYVTSIEDLTKIMAMRMQIPIIGIDAVFNLLPLKAKQDKAVKILHDQTRKVIDARRADLKKANITSLDMNNDFGIKNKHAFLDLLLLSEVDGKKIDDESVREEVDTFMFEGHDTTTSGIVYTLYCLSKNRDVQEMILAEQKSIMGDDVHADPSYNDLQQMRYLEMVIKEAMRLYPPVPMIERVVTKDCEAGGITLIKGTHVLLNLFQSQRHPDVFDSPLEFRPERFEQPLKNPFSWLAFSAGPRNCIGQKFAMMELKVTISSIVKNFILLPSTSEPELAADLILRSKNGVNVILAPRN